MTMTTIPVTLPDDLVAALPHDATVLQRWAQEALLVRLYALGEIGSGVLLMCWGFRAVRRWNSSASIRSRRSMRQWI